MNRREILDRLWMLRDAPYAALQRKLIPGIGENAVLGVRTPALRALAREAVKQPDTDAFLSVLPHEYFEENQLHAFILSEQKDFEKCLQGVEAFLPYVDNWATCDQMSPKCFRKHRADLTEPIGRWLRSERPFTVRFGVGMLMAHFLDEDFDPVYPEAVASLRSDAYYVRMMAAWYFATALAKQYDAALPYLTERRLDEWTHKKAVQKALESDRIPPDRKEILKALRKYEI